jgi:hypothetical protein
MHKKNRRNSMSMGLDYTIIASGKGAIRRMIKAADALNLYYIVFKTMEMDAESETEDGGTGTNMWRMYLFSNGVDTADVAKFLRGYDSYGQQNTTVVD